MSSCALVSVAEASAPGSFCPSCRSSRGLLEDDTQGLGSPLSFLSGLSLTSFSSLITVPKPVALLAAPLRIVTPGATQWSGSGAKEGCTIASITRDHINGA